MKKSLNIVKLIDQYLEQNAKFLEQDTKFLEHYEKYLEKYENKSVS